MSRTKKSQSEEERIAADFVVTELRRRFGSTYRAKVAELTGYPLSSVITYVSDGFSSQHFRRIIEAAVFRYEVTSWMEATIMKARADALGRLGVDPYLVQRQPELRALAKKIGFTARLDRASTDAIRREILATLSAQPNLRITTDPITEP